MVVYIAILTPSAIKANPEKRWSCIIAVPAKSLVSALGLIAVLGGISKFYEAIKYKEDRAINFVTAGIFGVSGIALYKWMLKTIRNK